MEFGKWFLAPNWSGLTLLAIRISYCVLRMDASLNLVEHSEAPISSEPKTTSLNLLPFDLWRIRTPRHNDFISEMMLQLVLTYYSHI